MLEERGWITFKCVLNLLMDIDIDSWTSWSSIMINQSILKAINVTSVEDIRESEYSSKTITDKITS